MALIVEDGTIVASANTYLDLAALKAYFSERAIDMTAYSDANLEAALHTATDLLEYNYTYKGSIVDETTPQVLLWPRTGLTDRRGITLPDTTIPPELLAAQAELARSAVIKIAEGERLEFSDAPSRQGVVTKSKLDVMEETYSETTSEAITTVDEKALDYVCTILKPYLRSCGLFQGVNEATI